MLDTELKVVLDQALGAEVGIEIKTDNVEVFKRRFYTFRADQRQRGNTAYNQLSCTTCPTDPKNKLWLVRKDAEETAIPNGEENCSVL